MEKKPETQVMEDTIFTSTRKSSEEVIVEVNIPSQISDWLQKSAIGRLKDVVYNKIINEQLIKQGVGVLRSPLCDKSLLIIFFSKEEMDIFLKDYCSMFEKWFSSVTPWMEDKVERQHQVWIRYVPMILWHEEFFSKIVGDWGRVLPISDITRSRNSLVAGSLVIG
ncbi:hypothetical protein COLO4_05328 [Corchorus olitorius]|uniref:DUF4283 domain-containing protein n=1 Tax=Corchorus olitorius TaxID=93759 RepID=A0A1R3KR75_9ROSI|nr:hypothetical protein COLO4_05328 [Corchorus olitorius]